MRRFSPTGQRTISALADRHGFSEDAVTSMLDSLMRGNGCTAQFSHPEFTGCGQWTRGGMTLLADMFDHDLKTRVDELCRGLSDLLAKQPELLRRGDVTTPAPSAQQQASIAGSAAQAGTSAAGLQQHGGQASAPAGTAAVSEPGALHGEEVFVKIERLAALRDRGFVSEEEYAAKKAELLARL